MGFYVRAAKAAFSSASILSVLSVLGACHHDNRQFEAGFSSKFKQDVSYCELLARSVAAQYEPEAKAPWFYKFGMDDTPSQKQKITDYVNHQNATDTQFVSFTALSLYDVAYQHMGINAVITLCLERKGHKDGKPSVTIASNIR